MALNIIDLIKGQLNPTLISQASTILGESESGVSKAISGFLPVILGGIANHSNNPSILDSITGAGSGNLLGNLLNNSNNNPQISTVLTSVFGDEIPDLVNSISTYSGVSNSSSSSLLNLVTGAILGSIGKYASENNISPSGIATILNDQKDFVSTLLPAGFTIGSFGKGKVLESMDTEKIKVTSFEDPKIEVNRGGETHVTSVPENNDGGSIWKWLLPLILLAVAAWFLWNNYNKETAQQNAMISDSAAIVEDTAMVLDDSAMMMENREMTDIDLNGTKLRGYSAGMEDNMIQFLKANSYNNAADDSVLKDTWYNFDNVNFEMASANKLLAGSDVQLRNLVQILKAYPESKIKIGGYTDNVGDPAVNKDLSQKRADFLKNELTKLGVGSQITGADGYGSEFATVPATASDSERAIDRNMAVRFAK
jgi:outer membrane protein OmpA-like peptidoglycan-associated protein